MRPLFAALLVTLLTVLTLHAADEVKPNTLTPEEIADGWLLLFDGETTFGWKIDGYAKVLEGRLVLGGDKETVATTTTEFPNSEVHFSYVMGLRSKAQLKVGKSCKELTGWLGHVLYQASFQDNEIVTFSEELTLGGGKQAGGKLFISDNQSRTAISFRLPAKTAISLVGIKLRPLGLKPIFNGKDLTGWKEAPNKKSKFTVSDKGELNIKDGPGDLQTEEQWDDFILQLECQSHGKHLNSGVFFRCIPGQYQNGYEAQIQNGYKDGDRSKPVDFGTGAIYRRVPARKVVSNDLEWFTMTVIAQGPHLATWVNGYQTVDWTDERPPDDNPRKGTKTGKGPISLQGHDPTTNLSFRNLRIAALPKGEKK